MARGGPVVVQAELQTGSDRQVTWIKDGCVIDQTSVNGNYYFFANFCFMIFRKNIFGLNFAAFKIFDLNLQTKTKFNCPSSKPECVTQASMNYMQI